MRHLKSIAALSAVALLAACAAREAGGERIVLTGSKAGESADAEGRPAPPPPPPPPLLRAPPPSAMARSVVVTGARGAFVPPVIVPSDPGRERYDGEDVSPVRVVANEPVSTFSVDVDTGAYANVRRFLKLGSLPPKDAVRTEELVNYFRYDYPAPVTRAQPFSVTTDVAVTPWNPDTRLVRIGLRGYDLPRASRPPANLVFLVDVSGSMNSDDKLPLVKAALSGLAGELGPKDKVSIVVYAGAAGLVLEPTGDAHAIRAALDRLSAGGSTAGGAGLGPRPIKWIHKSSDM